MQQARLVGTLRSGYKAGILSKGLRVVASVEGIEPTT